MSKEGLKRFIETAQADSKLKADFAAAVAGFARTAGFNVDAADVAQALDDMPHARDGKSGQDGYFEDRAKDWDDMYKGGGATTMALGEEDDAPRTREEEPTATSMALGEEDKPQPRVTSQAIGEEDEQGRPSVTLAIGEEDKKKPQPDPGKPRITTMAMGEEGNKPRTPRP